MGKGREHLKAGLAGLGTALAVLSVPAGLMELAVSSTGLAEILPAAAPPLGLLARALAAGFAGLMATGAMLIFRPPGLNAERGTNMGFALPKFAGFSRRAPRAGEREALPALRRRDAHPDAPPRQPIFAVRDLGSVEMFAAPKQEAEAAEAEEPCLPEAATADFRMPVAPEPLDDETIAREAAVAAAARPARSAARASLEGLSVAELADRLERGLSLRGIRHAVPEQAVAAEPVKPQPLPVLARIPPAQPVPVRAAVDDDVDEALRAALGTLRKMTARG
jgi:hypothetical protein